MILYLLDIVKTTKLADGSFCIQGIIKADLTRTIHFGYGFTVKDAIRDLKSSYKSDKVNFKLVTFERSSVRK